MYIYEILCFSLYKLSWFYPFKTSINLFLDKWNNCYPQPILTKGNNEEYSSAGKKDPWWKLRSTLKNKKVECIGKFKNYYTDKKEAVCDYFIKCIKGQI